MNENLVELHEKLNIIFAMLNYDVLEDERLSICKDYIERLKEDKQALNLFANRNCKTFELVKIFKNDYDNEIQNLYESVDFWSNLQFVVLLHEMTFNGNQQLIKKLYKKIKQQNKNNGIKNKNNGIKNNKSEEFDLETLKDLLFNHVSTNESTNLALDLMNNLKKKLNEKEKINPNELLIMTQELCSSYTSKIESGDINIKDLLGGVINMVKNPETIKEQFQGMENKFEGTPADLLTAVQENMKNNGLDTNEILKNINNPMDLLKNNDMMKMFGGANDMMKMFGGNNDKLIDYEKPVEDKKKQIEDYFDNLSL